MVESCYRSNTPLPRVFADAPSLQLGLNFYFQAFCELTTSRQIGFGAGPIPWYDLIRYARYHELTVGACADFVYLLRMMDNAYLDWVAEVSKKD